MQGGVGGSPGDRNCRGLPLRIRRRRIWLESWGIWHAERARQRKEGEEGERQSVGAKTATIHHFGGILGYFWTFVKGRGALYPYIKRENAQNGRIPHL